MYVLLFLVILKCMTRIASFPIINKVCVIIFAIQTSELQKGDFDNL